MTYLTFTASLDFQLLVVNKHENNKTTTPLDTIEYDGDYPVNDPVDVVEIFKV